MNMTEQVYQEEDTHSPFGHVPRSGVAESRGRFIFSFKNPPYWFPKWLPASCPPFNGINYPINAFRNSQVTPPTEVATSRVLH